MYVSDVSAEPSVGETTPYPLARSLRLTRVYSMRLQGRILKWQARAFMHRIRWLLGKLVGRLRTARHQRACQLNSIRLLIISNG